MQIESNASQHLEVMSTAIFHHPRHRSKFGPHEDVALVDLVCRYGVNCWQQIATHMPGRDARQCRDRWNHYLVSQGRRNESTGNGTVLLAAAQTGIPALRRTLRHSVPPETKDWSQQSNPSAAPDHSGQTGEQCPTKTDPEPDECHVKTKPRDLIDPFSLSVEQLDPFAAFY
jgi:hypothetical protein